MEIICLEDQAFYLLIEKVVQRIKEQEVIKDDKWIIPEEAMKRLNISSKTTLQKLRDTGVIRFSQTSKKVIMYDAESINQFIEKNAKNTL